MSGQVVNLRETVRRGDTVVLTAARRSHRVEMRVVQVGIGGQAVEVIWSGPLTGAIHRSWWPAEGLTVIARGRP